MVNINAMKHEQLLFEKNYRGNLYHVTTLKSAYYILKEQSFKFPHVLDEIFITDDEMVEEHLNSNPYFKKGYLYFLSTGRSKLNSYRIQNPGLAATFILNADYFNTKDFVILPTDYFWSDTLTFRKKESEERVFSRTERVSLACVKELHLRIDTTLDHEDAHISGIIENTNVPTFYYCDLKSYRLLDKRNTVSDFEIHQKHR